MDVKISGIAAIIILREIVVVSQLLCGGLSVGAIHAANIS